MAITSVVAFKFEDFGGNRVWELQIRNHARS